MSTLPRVRVLVAAMVLSAMPLAAQAPGAFGDTLAPTNAAARLERLQARVVQDAVTAYGARIVTTLPGWQSVVRDVERATELPWIGLPPVILVVPSAGGRGFDCDERDSCLGRFEGANLTVRGSDVARSAMSSIIVLAQSAVGRPDVWAHELTHALLTQHGKTAESARHDRRYFAETQFVVMGF